MRISKPIERWFDVPDDPDGARLKIRHLSPGEVADIVDQAVEQKIIYAQTEDGKMVPTYSSTTNRGLDRTMTMQKAVVDWENMFEADGKTKMECTPENVLRASREIGGFVAYVGQFRAKLAEDIDNEKETQRKN